MAFKYQTIWWSDNFRPFEHQTSSPHFTLDKVYIEIAEKSGICQFFEQQFFLETYSIAKQVCIKEMLIMFWLIEWMRSSLICVISSSSS